MLKKYFITGLLVWIPLIITLWVLNIFVQMMDQSLLLLPAAARPENLLGFRLPGVGVLLVVAVIVLTGLLAANMIGEKFVLMWEAILSRIPFVSSVYSSVKQVSDTLLSSQGQAFRKALLVKYPHHDSWSIAFLTGIPGEEIGEKFEHEMLSVYVPTTPNPTSGFFLIVPKTSTIELDLTVDQALRYIISMGVVAPHKRVAKLH